MVLKANASSNVLRLMTGTSIAQAIPIAVSPILTRIYTPEDFGIYALFLAIMVVISSIVSGRYELAIVLPNEDEDAFNIAALCLIIAGLVCSLLLVVIVLFGRYISNLLDNPDLYVWLYFLPLVIFFSAAWNVLNYLNTRLQSYKDIAVSQVYRSVTLAVSQIFIGWVRNGVAGLIVGQLLSSVAANGRLLKNLPSWHTLSSSVTWQRIKANAIRYINFPKYTSWAALTNAVSGSTTQMLLSVLYSVKTLGFYALTHRALSMPASLISSAVGQVLLQRASHEKKTSGNVLSVFLKALGVLVVISLPVFTVLYFIIEPLFIFVFGEEWAIAGEFAKIMMPLFSIQFVVSPLTIMNVVNEKNRLAMVANFILLALSVSTIYLSQYFGLDAASMLKALTIVLSSYYVGHLLVIYEHVKKMPYEKIDPDLAISGDRHTE